MEKTKQPRDERGRFLKTRPSREELEEKVKTLEAELLEAQKQCKVEAKMHKLWFDASIERGRAIEWLLNRVFPWTRRKFYKKFGSRI